MNLTGIKKKIIHEAFLSAYNDFDQLEMMVNFELNERLPQIVQEGPLETVIFDLLVWAENQGKVEDLLVGAFIDNPSNPKLAELKNLYARWNEADESSTNSEVHAQSDVTTRRETSSQASEQDTARAPTTSQIQEIPRQPFEPEMVLIPAGPFIMGSNPTIDFNADDDEFPQHSIFLPDYYIAKTPITNYQYLAFVSATSHDVPDHWLGGIMPRDRIKHPVASVSWHDAVAYCKWLSEATGRVYRLPTEAEWEKAARGTDGYIYPWGNEPPTDKLCNFNHNIGDTTPVDNYPSGASPYDCRDMAGNVWEWCSSLHKSYPYRVDDGREDMETVGLRTLRGGSFWASLNIVVRCASRNGFDASLSTSGDGFRVVQEVVATSIIALPN